MVCAVTARWQNRPAMGSWGHCEIAHCGSWWCWWASPPRGHGYRSPGRCQRAPRCRGRDLWVACSRPPGPGGSRAEWGCAVLKFLLSIQNSQTYSDVWTMSCYRFASNNKEHWKTFTYYCPVHAENTMKSLCCGIRPTVTCRTCWRAVLLFTKTAVQHQTMQCKDLKIQ